MATYKRSVKSQLAKIFCCGVFLAFAMVITLTTLMIVWSINGWINSTVKEVESLQFIKNSYSLQSRGSMVQNLIQFSINEMLLLAEVQSILMAGRAKTVGD